jgi:branched-chain amino acid transport system substrate-binding protein
MKVSPEYVSGLLVQWQGGKQMTVWPSAVANAKVTFPSFIKLPAN